MLLSDVLVQLEDSYDVKFSYNAKAIEGIRISIDLNKESLASILSEVESLALVSFRKIDKRYYILKPIRRVTICGTVIDKATNDPIIGAAIVNLNGGKGAASNEKGFFKIEKIQRSDTISISFLGYKSTTVPVEALLGKECKTLGIEISKFTLSEVVVRKFLASSIANTEDGAIRINPNAREVLSGQSEPDILQSVQLLPGIESPSETASGLYIRGGTPDQNLILWDGIKMYNSDHFFGMLSAFNPYITDDVKVYRSGAKPQYGDRVSGVIDINTNSEVPEKTEAGIGLNMTHGDVYLKQPLGKKAAIHFSARRSITDIVETPTFREYSDLVFQNTGISFNRDQFQPGNSQNNELFYFTDFTLKAVAELSEEDKLTISNLFTRNKLDFTFEDTQADIRFRDRLNVENFGTNASWKRRWSDRFSSETSLNYSQYDLDYSGRNRFSADSDFFLNKENQIEELGVLFQGDLKLNDRLTFSNGYQFYLNDVDFLLENGTTTFSDEAYNQTHAFYSQFSYNKPESWYLDLGVRANYYATLDKVFWEPRIYTEYNLTKNLSLRGSAELRNQSISQVVEFATLTFGLENEVWALVNDDQGVPLQRSRQFSAGLVYEKEGWNVDIDGYVKRTSGLTSFSRGFRVGDDTFSEGKSNTTGVEVMVKKKVNDFTTWLGYTWAKTDFNFDNLNSGNDFRGNNDIRHSYSWSNFYQWKNFQFSLNWRYRTGRPYTEAVRLVEEPDVVFIEFGELNAKRLPDYHRLDFSVTYDFKFSKKKDGLLGKAGISILNLYGQRNMLDKDFFILATTDGQGNSDFQIQEVTNFSLGRTPNLFLRVSF